MASDPTSGPHRRDGLLERLTDGLTDRVAETVDVDRVLDHVDLDRLLAHVDVNHLLDRIDVERVLDRVDVNHLLDRIDVERVLDRVDVEQVVQRIDVESLVRRAGIPEIVQESTGAFAGSTLDLIRRQIAGIDVVVSGFLQRLRGSAQRRPNAPPLLAAEIARRADEAVGPGYRQDVSGCYAGPVSRAIALAIDLSASNGLFGLGVAAISWVTATLLSAPIEFDGNGLLWLGAWALWLLMYYWVGLVLAGKTVGMALVGLKVVARDGGPLPAREALIRVLVLPVSITLLPLGAIGPVFGAERRSIHDVAAGSVVVSDWGPRAAELPTLVSTVLERTGGSTLAGKGQGNAAPTPPSGRVGVSDRGDVGG